MAIYKSKAKTKDGRQYFFRIKYKNILGEVCDYTLKINKTLTTKLKGISWHILSPKTKNSTRILPIPKNVFLI